jgi:DHA1 family inner membrane transport protein
MENTTAVIDCKTIEEKQASSRSASLALLTLAICAFAIGTTEFVTTGLLTDLARVFDVSIPVAGFVTSGYALGVVVGAPLLTAATIHLSRKYVLIGLMGLFIVGSIVSALAPTFSILMVGRFISALSHGAFFGIGSVVVTSMVEPKKRATAIALMFTGLTLANVLGVPMGTLLGQHYGWRSSFWVISLLGAIGLSGIVFLVPKQSQVPSSNLGKELAAFKRPEVWLALAITAMGFSGLLASFAYVAPIMTEVAGYAPSSIAWLLALYGVGLVFGNYFGGKAADRNLNKTIYVFLTLLALLLIAFVFTAHYKILAAMNLFLLGVFGFGLIPPLQMQIMNKAKEAPTLASAANISAFNLGTALGVFLGGYTIHAGFGFTSPNWVGAMLTVIGLGIFMLSRRSKRNEIV